MCHWNKNSASKHTKDNLVIEKKEYINVDFEEKMTFEGGLIIESLRINVLGSSQ